MTDTNEETPLCAGQNKWRNWRAPDFYKEISIHNAIPEEWHACPVCEEKPRLWIFDNGAYAKCKCQDTYDDHAARGKTIWEYHREHNGDMTNWNHNDLRDNWNKYVQQIKDQICQK